MGRRIRRTNRRSNLRKVRKSMKRKTMKRKTMKRKSMKRKTMKRKTMKRRNNRSSRRNFRRMRGAGEDAPSVIVSMGKFGEGGDKLISKLKISPDEMIYVSAGTNDITKITKAIQVYETLQFAGPYVMGCENKPELNDALEYGEIISTWQDKADVDAPLDKKLLEKYEEAVGTLCRIVGANMRTETGHDELVDQYKTDGKHPPNKLKLSVRALKISKTILESLTAGNKCVFIEDLWYPGGSELLKTKRGRGGRPGGELYMTRYKDPIFKTVSFKQPTKILLNKIHRGYINALSEGNSDKVKQFEEDVKRLTIEENDGTLAPCLGKYLNDLNKLLMSNEGAKSFLADLEAPFALVNPTDIDKSRELQKNWLKELEHKLYSRPHENNHAIFKTHMDTTFTVNYNEIFVQTDVYSNPKEIDDLLAILCLSRMCKKLILSFDNDKISENFQTIFPTLVEHGLIVENVGYSIEK